VKELVVSDAAAADLRGIAAFTLERWGAAQKRRYLAVIRQRFRILRRSPTLGRSRNDISPGLRGIAAGSHVVFYRDGDANTILVVRILHQSMDMQRHLAAS
jgi:toxin ParE1/3/4